MTDLSPIELAKELVKSSSRISALTGAGISVDSGIPDFRSEGGLWTRYDPHEYATYESFLNDPSKFWTMGKELAELLIKAVPNPGHKALVDLEEDGRLIGIITQNIDNLHQMAGSKKVIEIHGNYLRAFCMECKKEYVGESIHKRVAGGEVPPLCDDCGGVLKSEAVLFGEPLPEIAMSEAIEVCRSTDLMLVVGTSLTVYPGAYLPQLAKTSGARIVLISLEGTNRDHVADVVIRGNASEVLPSIV